MASDIYQMGDHPDGVRAICKECESVTLADSEVEAGKIVDNHNEQRHGGDEVAGICAWDVEPLPDASDLPIEVLYQIGQSLTGRKRTTDS